jgi:hypothetical protein
LQIRASLELHVPLKGSAPCISLALLQSAPVTRQRDFARAGPYVCMNGTHLHRSNERICIRAFTK